MDANEKDAAKLRRREEMLAQRVGKALDRLDSGGAGECPDAELIAAYSERALSPEESANWENHFAACARCRTVLRVLAASGETPLSEREIAHLGELVSAAGSASETKKEFPTPIRRRSPDWRVRWLAPAMGVAAALAVWFAWRPPWRVLQRQSSETLVAQAPKVETQPHPIIAPAPEELAEKKPETTPTREADKKSAPLASSAGKLTSSLMSRSRNLNQQDNKQLTVNGEATVPAVSPKEIAPPAPVAMQPPQAVTQSKSDAASSQPVPPSATQTVTVTEEAPVVETANGVTSAAGGAPNRDDQSAKEQVQANPSLADTVTQESAKVPSSNKRNFQALSPLNGPVATGLLLKSPSGSVLWRTGKNGMIEQSMNQGGTWRSQESPTREDWLAGSAVSDAVCWLTGRNGAIARTTDGEHWELVMPPAQAATTAGKMPDWIGITARGPLSATVTARDGRRFATSDGGSSWQPQ